MLVTNVIRAVLACGGFASASTAALAPAATNPRRMTMTCGEGDKTIAFVFDGKGGATLSRVERKEIASFADL